MIQIPGEAFWAAISVLIVLVGGIVAYAAKVSRLNAQVETLKEGQSAHEVHCQTRHKAIHERLDKTATQEALTEVKDDVKEIRKMMFKMVGAAPPQEREV